MLKYSKIFTGLDTSKDMVIPAESFQHFLNNYQGESLDIEDVKSLIDLHEPHPELKKRSVLGFEGFARYLLDQSNSALKSDSFDESDMDYPISYYYIASSHNTYLTSLVTNWKGNHRWSSTGRSVSNIFPIFCVKIFSFVCTTKIFSLRYCWLVAGVLSWTVGMEMMAIRSFITGTLSHPRSASARSW